MRTTAVSVITLVSFLAATLLAPVAEAGIISTESYVQQAEADAQRDKVIEMLQREDVREQMLAMGVDPANIEARLAGLSDAEVAELAAHMEEMPAGAGVLELLLVVFLVFVILDIAGVTDVFPFINAAE
ncbi:MAG TPA: PA2779 family protein [Gammaproteobacteria bacterium]